MSDAVADEAEVPKRKGKGLVLGLVAALVLAGVGFAVTYLGFVSLPSSGADHAEETGPQPLPDVDFIPMEPITISLGPTSSARHLIFRGELEVPSSRLAEVTHLLPRVRDVLNGYLRAVDAAMLEDPTTLPKLKAQMLRRILIVTGPDTVSDLLISEFVLN